MHDLLAKITMASQPWVVNQDYSTGHEISSVEQDSKLTRKQSPCNGHATITAGPVEAGHFHSIQDLLLDKITDVFSPSAACRTPSRTVKASQGGGSSWSA